MPATEQTHPLGTALGRRFASAPRRDEFADSLRVQNQRRNLNLDMIALMERGHRIDSPEVKAIRAKLAALTPA